LRVTASSTSDDSISYEDYRYSRNLVGSRGYLSNYLTPALFLRLASESKGSVDMQTLFKYLETRTNVDRLHCQLQFYDVDGSGFLSETAVETFISDLIPSLEGLKELESDFKQFYIYTAARKFMFFLDPRRTGQISVRAILSSKILEEFLGLRDGPQASANWFSLDSTTTVYSRYIDMDGDGDGMLSKEELVRYPSALLTSVSVERIFQEHMTFQGMLDYKGYLDLVLTLDNPTSEVSIKYTWKVLDVHKTGRLNFADISPFLKAIFEILNKTVPTAGYTMYKPEHIYTEILDSLGILDRDYIEINDMIKSAKKSILVAPMLIDGQAFYQHDNREQHN
jgi:serine/threonine-protein phosphatase 2A regulatory subunit B''